MHGDFHNYYLIVNMFYRMPMTADQIKVLKRNGPQLARFIDIENGLLLKLHACDVITSEQMYDINSQVGVHPILSTDWLLN